MRAFIYLFCILAASATGCTSLNNGSTPVEIFKPDIPKTAELRSMLIGRWYGEATHKGGGKRQWLVERFDDGRLLVNFIIETPNETIEQSEIGQWGVSGPIYFTITQGWLEDGHLFPADRTDAGLYDAYQIIQITPDLFRYRSIEVGDEFTVKRVTQEFVFPPPLL